jgi:hypothetical protein
MLNNNLVWIAANSEKPVLHRQPPSLKNLSFKTGDLKF